MFLYHTMTQNKWFSETKSFYSEFACYIRRMLWNLWVLIRYKNQEDKSLLTFSKTEVFKDWITSAKETWGPFHSEEPVFLHFLVPLGQWFTTLPAIRINRELFKIPFLEPYHQFSDLIGFGRGPGTSILVSQVILMYKLCCNETFVSLIITGLCKITQ